MGTFCVRSDRQRVTADMASGSSGAPSHAAAGPEPPTDAKTFVYLDTRVVVFDASHTPLKARGSFALPAEVWSTWSQPGADTQDLVSQFSQSDQKYLIYHSALFQEALDSASNPLRSWSCACTRLARAWESNFKFVTIPHLQHTNNPHVLHLYTPLCKNDPKCLLECEQLQAQMVQRRRLYVEHHWCLLWLSLAEFGKPSHQLSYDRMIRDDDQHHYLSRSENFIPWLRMCTTQAVKMFPSAKAQCSRCGGHNLRNPIFKVTSSDNSNYLLAFQVAPNSFVVCLSWQSWCLDSVWSCLGVRQNQSMQVAVDQWGEGTSPTWVDISKHIIPTLWRHLVHTRTLSVPNNTFVCVCSAHCQKYKPGSLKPCKECHKVNYCNNECRSLDSKRHKPACYAGEGPALSIKFIQIVLDSKLQHAAMQTMESLSQPELECYCYKDADGSWSQPEDKTEFISHLREKPSYMDNRDAAARQHTSWHCCCGKSLRIRLLGQWKTSASLW